MCTRLFILFSCFANFTFSQSNNVGIGTSDPAESSILELKSSDQGFLLPRLSNNQRNEINNPAPGLMIYNIGSHCINYFNGSAWLEQCGRSISDLLPNAIYVDHQTGSDNNDGNPNDPVATINKAIELSQSQSKDSIIIAAGLYEEKVLPLDGNILLGSYSRTSWTPILSGYPVTRIQNTDPSEATGSALFIENKMLISVKHIEIVGRNCFTGCSTAYAAIILNSQDITLDSLNVIAGNGSQGSRGNDGSDGINGQDGSDATFSSGGIGGGFSGGDGGINDNDGEPGINGSQGFAPGAGGAGGSAAAVNQSAEPGNDGGDGGDGNDGFGGSSFGVIQNGYYQQSIGGDGSIGSDGGGGGGGGSGGGINIEVNGGGGGAFGTGGQRGTGGESGGGSFGLWVSSSSVVVNNSSLHGGSAGNGGSGGVGGIGGAGGSGGSAAFECGPAGGDGGDGGKGGHGGGGSGGPSFCIYSSNTSQIITDNVNFVIGYAGQPGISYGMSGSTGLSGDKNF
jgi:hypothetical protein